MTSDAVRHSPMRGMHHHPGGADCPLRKKVEAGEIDCPLRNSGHGHHKGDLHRPFKTTAEYIAHLDKPERQKWQRPEKVISALGLKPNSVVADVGAGSGYFSLRIARRVPKGDVLAIDIDAKMLAHIRKHADKAGLKNVTTVQATPTDPKVNDRADVVLIADVLHHVADRKAWLGRIFRAMKPGARLALIEFKAGDLPKGPPARVKIPRKQLTKLLTGVGFEAPTVDDKLLPYQLLLIAKKPAPTPKR